MPSYKLIFIAFCFSACQAPSLSVKESTSTTFFDLNSFFEKEALSLSQQNIHIQKKIQQNEETEEHLLAVKNWDEELRIFRECDINKPSWKSKYTLDSTTIEDGLVLLHYKALDENLSTQVLDIKLANKEVHSILVVKKTSTQIYESQQYLTYIPQKSYTIKNSQDVILLDKNEYHIEAKYIRQ